MSKIIGLVTTIIMIVVLSSSLYIGVLYYPTEENTKDSMHNKWIECLEYTSTVIEDDCIDDLFKEALLDLPVPKTEEEFNYFFKAYLSELINSFLIGAGIIFIIIAIFGTVIVFHSLKYIGQLRVYIIKDEKY